MKSFVFPGDLSPETLAIGARQVPYMRTHYFSKIVLECQERLLRLFHAPKGKILFYTSSGTGAMDAIVQNFVSAQGKALVIAGGSFGYRWRELCNYYNIPNVLLEVPFAKDIDYKKLERIIIEEKPKVLLCQHHETSSGQLFNMSRIGKICKSNNVILITDAISSFLSDPLDMEEMNIDICLVSSQKGLNIPPGIALVALSEHALSLPFTARNYYFDFDNNLKNLERGQTPFSPATTIFLQLQQRLREIEQIGLKKILSQNKHKANYFRALCNEHGWRILPENPSNAITCFQLKQNGDRLFNDLQEMGFCIMPSTIANNFRVTHTGLQTETDLDELAHGIAQVETKTNHHPIRVFTSGSFDLFHIGHLNILEKSAALGDKLIVGVSTDELIESYKGVKPTIPFEQRKRTIAALSCVAKVVTQKKLTEIKQLKEERIDIVTIGDDWKNKYLEGLEWIKQQPNKKVVYFPYTDGVSTTDIKQQIINDSYSIIQASMNRQHKLEKDWPEDKH